MSHKRKYIFCNISQQPHRKILVVSDALKKKNILNNKRYQVSDMLDMCILILFKLVRYLPSIKFFNALLNSETFKRCMKNASEKKSTNNKVIF